MTRHLLRAALPGLFVLAVLGCSSEDEGGTRPEGIAPADSGQSDTGASTESKDTETDRDGSADRAADPGETADSSGQPGSDVTSGDSGVPPEPLPGAASVYLQSPAVETETTEVVLADRADPEGKLTGTNARVYNCLNKAGGDTIDVGGGSISLCKMEQTAVPGEDGTYLHIQPSSDKDPNDPFAEVMMYHHMTYAHRYFTADLGMEPLQAPLLALVNVQLGAGVFWLPFDNAAFIPQLGFAELGLPSIGEDAIVFGQGSTVDFAYDAAVIRHEYTHALVGATRLMGATLDEHGLDNAPGSLNEGHADYFAATMADDPVIGSYALQAFAGGDMSRDLSRPRVCPEHLAGEVHQDGEIYGSALWEVRGAVGAEIADRVIFDALQGLSLGSTFAIAAEATVERAREEGEDVASKVEEAFDNHHVRSCARVKAHEDFTVTGMGGGRLPIIIDGTQTTGHFAAFPDFAPSYIQYFVEVPEGTLGLRLTVAVPALPFGLGGGGEELEVAWRRGEPVSYTYPQGSPAVMDADARVPFASVSDTQVVTLSGSCLSPGRHFYQLLNKGQGQVQIPSVKLEPLTQDPGEGNYECR